MVSYTEVSSYLSQPLTVVGSLASIYGCCYLFWQSATSDARFGMALMAAFATSLFVINVAQRRIFSRKTLYGEFLTEILDIHNRINQENLQKLNNRNDILQVAKAICNDLSNLMRLVTGRPCAACIKVVDAPVDEEGQVSTYTFCRDSRSLPKRNYNEDKKHWISANTDFLEIFRHEGPPITRYFFENYLPSRQGYNNSRFESSGFRQETLSRWVRPFFRSATWPLPYKSTIVVPIFPLVTDEDPPPVMGFLCVDSPARGVFRQQYDVGLIRSVAACLYPIMSRLSDIEAEEEQGE